MNVSIYNQYQQIERLIVVLKDYMDNLRYHAIIKPKEVLDEAFRNGLPEEIYNTYLGFYYALNEQDAQGIVVYIEKFCIPYLEKVSKDLYEALHIN